jgi:hypothetical protein
MKRLLFFAFMLLAAPGWACDVCGCSGANFYLGVLPQFQKHFVGVRYRTQSYDTFMSRHHIDQADSRESFQAIDLWARFYPLRRVQVLAMVPYQFHQQTQGTDVRRLQGLGDATVLINYKLIDKARIRDSTHVVKHSLLLGGGIKLATGDHRYSETDLTDVANPNFQPGTGATDLVLNGIYTLRVNRWGMNADATGRITGTNAEGYQFGNRMNGSLIGFYVKQWGSTAVMPSAGLYGEYARKDHKNGVLIAETGGYLVAAALGLDAYRGNWVAGVNAQLPVQQRISEGLVKAHNRLAVHLSRMF